MDNAEILRNLIPLNALAPSKFRELQGQVRVEQLPKKSALFNEGDSDNDMVYLLSGEVLLKSKQGKTKKTISAGTEESRFALAQLKPRQMSGLAVTDVTIARVDGEALDNLLTWDQLDSGWEQVDGYEVEELSADVDSDWMLTMLHDKLFQQLPTDNIHALFTRMEPMEVKAGEVIIKQGDPGDYFYIIKQGKCTVSRKSDQSGKVALLSELSDSNSFGEEALLSGAPRNATIIMKQDGILMRLSKSDFDELLKSSVVKMVTVEQAQKIVKQGGALIDVRLEAEYKSGCIKGSVNIPLYLLRLKAKALPTDRPYVLCCQTGNRSMAAAFLLEQRGFNVSVLEGGLVSLAQPAAHT